MELLAQYLSAIRLELVTLSLHLPKSYLLNEDMEDGDTISI